jgi:NAD(P)-dependent dehydrogenase (short-subunit alcohol dehydrogenase family)
LKLTAHFGLRAAGSPAASGAAVHGRKEAADRDAAALLPGLSISDGFAPEGAGLAAFVDHHGLDERGVTPWQVAALLAQSYVVGMELPGRRALFSALALAFQAVAVAPRFQLTARVAELDTRFALARVAVELQSEQGAPVATAQLSALVRAVLPPPDPGALAQRLPPSQRLGGRVALVTGASRGLGAAITRALLSQGCTVLANFRHSDTEMAALAASTKGFPGTLVPVQGDAGSADVCHQLHQRIVAQHGRLDFLICNASPALRAFGLEATTLPRAAAFVQESLALTSAPLAHMLELVEGQRGHVVFISSEAVSVAPKGWSHYVAAKAACEGLLRGVAADSTRVRFSVYRPPRLLTDFTNMPLGAEAALSPDVVAVRVVTDLLTEGPAGELQLVTDFGSA